MECAGFSSGGEGPGREKGTCRETDALSKDEDRGQAGQYLMRNAVGAIGRIGSEIRRNGRYVRGGSPERPKFGPYGTAWAGPHRTSERPASHCTAILEGPFSAAAASDSKFA